MKAIVFDAIGSPQDVLYLHDVPMPRIGDGEVLVRMVSASVNPGDFLFIQNLYPEPKKPHFPHQIAGNHGAGIIDAVGANVALKPGTLVAFSHYNSWAEYAAVPAEWLIPLPADYPLERAGQMVNSITAWDLLADSRVQPGQWLAVTAGYSSVSTMVMQFAKRRGINVIALVRRSHDRLDLKRLGATATLDLSDLKVGIREAVMDMTGGAGLNGIIDNVGGPASGELIRTLAMGGQMVINGGMSSERFELHNFDVLLSGVEIRANIYRYFFSPPVEADRPVLREIVDIFGQPDFHISVGGIHPLAQFELAVANSLDRADLGKQIFRMQPGP
ncbi:MULTISPECIES: zinc-binding dehydrogenase [unclassified Mesorhizobium]|uniref:quinone oxidoreductase family protein n=1 Tax=unclassified Mesorhizobium TaxID=325217 RepID=UPI001218CA5E|nr:MULTISPECIES: zinc-binding dehydrogenase [unclassified Mesorhizobium]TIM53789.1 MAG: alcohol dehydrogenase [Mesorhizobium sp.]TIQ67246.1 MAG: alcohol dehydrogenase [Mesorhizobium sp.]